MLHQKSRLRSARSSEDDMVDRGSYSNAGKESGLDTNEKSLHVKLHEPNTNSLRTGASGANDENMSRSGGRPLYEREGVIKSRFNETDDDVPASLLLEANLPGRRLPRMQHIDYSKSTHPSPSYGRVRASTQPAEPTQRKTQQERHPRWKTQMQPRSAVVGNAAGTRRDRALWRWVNTSNVDSFMRDVYDYFEGGGMYCILCSNALWLLETLFVTVLLTFVSQCIDYRQLPSSKSLSQVVVKQCPRTMSGVWNLGIWLYCFFFIWKSVQYFFEMRRLKQIRDFFIFLLDVPDQDMQTVSWQDIVARIMALRDQNPKTAINMPHNLRRFIGSQSKERLDAHDIANRLMRKDNYLIAMVNKDVLNLCLPIPFLRKRQLFSKTMEWYLHYGILDMAFNELGQVRQDFLRADKRAFLSQKLRHRLYFAGLLNLMFAPVVLAYVIIVYFFTYYNEYQKDPKLAAARKYTALAELKFREFNELPHIFYERLHMSYPFATRYMDQFPKRMTEEIARSIAFMSGALTAVLAVGTILDSELFLGFEITKDRTVLFYLGVFGAIWAMTRGMVSEETTVFNPEYALRNVIEYTHFMPDHWHGKLHSFETKREFSELYKIKVVIFLEEIMGIITTPMLLLFSLPKCSDQIVDFFREFTVHVDGLGYVCSFAVFDFKKGVESTKGQGFAEDVRDDYYTTKHGKMAASYYGFLDNYVINPKTGIPGHLPPGTLQTQFHPPPTFPSLNSPTLAADMQSSTTRRAGTSRARTDRPGLETSYMNRSELAKLQPPPMMSMLLDLHHQPTECASGAKSMHQSTSRRMALHNDAKAVEEMEQSLGANRVTGSDADIEDDRGILGESVWEMSPNKGLSRENSAAVSDEPETGVLGLIYQMQQTQHNRRGTGGY